CALPIGAEPETRGAPGYIGDILGWLARGEATDLAPGHIREPERPAVPPGALEVAEITLRHNAASVGGPNPWRMTHKSSLMKTAVPDVGGSSLSAGPGVLRLLVPLAVAAREEGAEPVE